MGRSLTALLLAILATLLTPAAALAVDGDGEFAFAVPLQASHGLGAKLEADDDEIDLTIRKDEQRAVYFAEGETSRDRVAVKFGELGEFVADYEPFRTLESREPNRHCKGEPKTTTEGYFRGAIRFRGEDGYVRIEAARVKGTRVLVPIWDCDYRRSAAASRVDDTEAESDDATLVAASRHDLTGLLVVGSRPEEERPFTFFWAQSAERRKGMSIIRSTIVESRSDSFRFDNRRGTAFVDPPAPFAGSARYVRRPHAPDSWRGSLTAPFLGLGRVRLAGPGFRAKMMPELPTFD